MTKPKPPPAKTEQPDDDLVRAVDRDQLPIVDVWIDGRLVEMPAGALPPPAPEPAR